MARPSKLVIGALLAVLGASAHAGYAQAVPPAGFSQLDPAASTGRWGYARAANEAWTTSTVRTNATLNVGGRTVTMPAAMRLASNAPRYVAAALYLHPGIRTVATVAAWLGAAQVGYNVLEQAWEKYQDGTPVGKVPGITYQSMTDGKWHSTQQAAMQAELAYLAGWKQTALVFESYEEYRGTLYFWYTNANGTGRDSRAIPRQNGQVCPQGSTETPGGCIVAQPAKKIETSKEFEDALTPQPMPPEIPGELPPGIPLPVDPPVINPAPGPLPETPAAPRPWFVPQGDPVPNPNYNPSAPTSPENQPYIRPGVNIKPSPTLTEPWRVDLQPVDRPTDSDAPKTDEELNPQPDPDNPETQPKDKPKEDQSSLCEKHPDIAACAKMDEVEPEDVHNEQKELSITPTTGWETGAGTCPAPVTRQVAGLTLEMEWQPFCDLATGIRPVVVALAWIAAAMMVIGVARRGE